MTLTDHDTTHDLRLTRQGRRALKARARQLRDKIIPNLQNQRNAYPGDNTLRAETERATAELSRITSTLATALPAETIPDDPQVVELGETVTIHIDGLAPESYLIVHPCEAGTGNGAQTSALSPLGQALLGRRVGDTVEVPAPGGCYRCVIESATRTEPAPARRRNR